MVSECKAQAGVLKVASLLPNGSVAKHLSGLSYGAPQVPKPPLPPSSTSSSAPAASLMIKNPSTRSIKLGPPSAKKPPVVLPPRKRASGGKHKPGTRPGVNGHTHRTKKGIGYKDPAYDALKLGTQPREARKKHQQTYRKKASMKVQKTKKKVSMKVQNKTRTRLP